MALPQKLQQFVDESAMLDKLTRSMLLLDYATKLGDYPEDKKDDLHRVRGCTSLVYLDANFDEQDGTMRYKGYADAQIVKGMVAVLVNSLDGESPESVLAVDPEFIQDAGLGEALSTTRQGGLANILRRMQNAASAALARS
ncbi:MAG: SufE family protein [Rubricoccaceae bacterium]|nr:SufE family protein [Rubricoccaceae bacterium]